MKFFGLLVIAVCVGTSSAGLFSKMNSVVSDTNNLLKSTLTTATNTAKHTATAATNTVESVVKAVSTAGISSGVSVLLAQVRALVKTTGNSNIHIPDIAMSKGPVHFNATGGFFRDISSLTQAGKANVTTNGTSILIDIAVKLSEIETGYENFTLSSWKLKASGGIKIHVANDTFVIHLRLKPGLSCALNVEKVDVTEFGGIDLDFINMGSKSQWVLEKFSNLIVKYMKENIKNQVQTAVDTSIKKVLKENGSVCSKFLG